MQRSNGRELEEYLALVNGDYHCGFILSVLVYTPMYDHSQKYPALRACNLSHHPSQRNVRERVNSFVFFFTTANICERRSKSVNLNRPSILLEVNRNNTDRHVFRRTKLLEHQFRLCHTLRYCPAGGGGVHRVH
jgi:hypothetical protein